MEDSGIRDRLALARTELANERTFLAYVRTALSLLAGGAVLLHFFAANIAITVSGWTLIVLGGLVLLFGLARFVRVRSRLKSSGAQDPD
jgi:putative membrane protein